MSRILKILVNIIIIGVILTVIALTVPQLFGIKTTVIDDSSINTNLPLGSVTYSEKVAVSELAVGDSVLVSNSDKTFRYLIEEISTEDSKYTVSDSTLQDGTQESITLKNNAFKIRITVAFIGYLLIAIQSTEGIIVLVVAALFLIFLQVLAELMRKDSYDEDDEEDDDEDAEDELALAEPVTGKERRIARKKEKQLEKQRLADEKRQDKEDRKKDKEARHTDKKKDKKKKRTKDDSDWEAPEREEALSPAAAKQRAADSFLSGYDSSGSTAAETNDTAVARPTPVAEAPLPVIQGPFSPEPMQVTEACASAPVSEQVQETYASSTKVVIPRMTARELMDKAAKEGDFPEMIKDEVAGISVLDYTDIILDLPDES
ncbi:MAG: hypothetical protein ACK5MN_09690 [Lachnospiraceae bacterium]